MVKYPIYHWAPARQVLSSHLVGGFSHSNGNSMDNRPRFPTALTRDQDINHTLYSVRESRLITRETNSYVLNQSYRLNHLF